MKLQILLSLALVPLMSGLALTAEETPTSEVIIKDHKFQPSVIEVPANRKIKLVIKNQDPTPEEFESYQLNREKVIPGGAQTVIFIGPLQPESYPFFGEFNQATAQGKIIVK
jgi:hypothetical protein